MAKVTAAIALLCSILYSGLSVYVHSWLASWDQAAVEIGFGSAVALLAVVFLCKSNSFSRAKKGVWLGALVGSAILFLLMAGSVGLNIARHSTSILTDGVLWWMYWFLPVIYLGIPAVAIGALIGWLIALAFGRRKA